MLDGGFTVVVRGPTPDGHPRRRRVKNLGLAGLPHLDDALVVIVALMLDGVLAGRHCPKMTEPWDPGWT